jgi:hypothetical protein
VDGYDMLQCSYRGVVAEHHSVVISHEHDAAQWVKAADMRVLLTDEVIEQIARGDDRIADLVRGVRTDLDHYLRRTGRG